RHRQGGRNDEGNRQREHLHDDAGGQTLPDEVAELLGDLLNEQKRGQRGEREHQRRNELPQQVAAEDAHGGSRHYIRTSTALQGMRRPTLAGFLALALVVPRLHAQDRAAPDSGPRFIAGFHVAPIVVPYNAALAPGGRLGPRTSPALVAAAWEARLRASLPGGLTPAAAPAPGQTLV